MSDEKYNYHISRINRVIDYIDCNLDKQLTLEELSACGQFSKYHFHRIFKSIVGESLFRYILRLRLEKSANLLLNHPKEKIGIIAIQCGFSDVSIFTRNFKKYYRRSPSVFKKEAIEKSNLSQIESNKIQQNNVSAPYFCSKSKTIKWTNMMEVIKQVEVKKLEAITVGYNRNLGPYKGNNALYRQHREELFSWAASRDIMSDPNFKYLILYHDNPNIALNDTQRMSLCVTIPKSTKTDGVIGKMAIEGGNYLICQCELRAEDFSKVWDWIYGYWFPKNHFVPDDKPYFELYKEQPMGDIFKVDFCIPVIQSNQRK